MRTNQSIIYHEISTCLEKRREELGMSKRRLATLSGVTPVYLREVLRGERRPSILILMLLCRALDIKLSEVLADIESRNVFTEKPPDA